MNDSSDNRLIQAYHRVIVVMMQHICSWIIFSDNMKMNRLVTVGIKLLKFLGYISVIIFHSNFRMSLMVVSSCVT